MEKNTAEKIIEEQVAFLVANPTRFNQVLDAMENGDKKKLNELGVNLLYMHDIINQAYNQSAQYHAAFQALGD